MTETNNEGKTLPDDCDMENLKISVECDGNSLNNNNEVEAADEANTDSEEYSVHYERLQYSTRSNASETTIRPSVQEDDNITTCSDQSLSNLQIPIVGYEVMEERAKFTVFKLRIENKASGDCWYVFRRYTDFVRLCNKIKHSFPDIVKYLPRKRWLGNNFDTLFLDERANGLQTLVNAIISEPNLISSDLIQDFFCLNEPPVYSESNEESRAMFEALEDTIYQLKQQILEKEKVIDQLGDTLHSKTIENDNLRKVIMNSDVRCKKCQLAQGDVSKK